MRIKEGGIKMDSRNIEQTIIICMTFLIVYCSLLLNKG